MSKYDVVAIGEILIDFTPMKDSKVKAFIENPGGAPCNMLTMAQKLGSKTAFIGQVGKDQFGIRLGQVLEDQGIDTKGLVYTPHYPTTLAFVHLAEDGDRSFSFYRKGCADVMIEEKDIDWSLIEATQALHFGSLSLTDEPSASTALKVIQVGRKKGKLITYDPNYRPLLWPSKEKAIEGMKRGLVLADVVKVSDEEAFLLTGMKTVPEAAEKLYEEGLKLVCVTLGGEGAYFIHASGAMHVAGYLSQVVDTTGAGDTFFGAVVHGLIAGKKEVENYTLEEIREIVQRGNVAASLCVEKYGGISAIPNKKALLERQKS